MKFIEKTLTCKSYSAGTVVTFHHVMTNPFILAWNGGTVIYVMLTLTALIARLTVTHVASNDVGTVSLLTWVAAAVLDRGALVRAFN